MILGSTLLLSQLWEEHSQALSGAPVHTGVTSMSDRYAHCAPHSSGGCERYLIWSNACRRVPEGTAYGSRKAWQQVQETTLGVQSGSRVGNAGHHRPSPFWSDCGCHWPSVGHLPPHLTQTRNTPRAFWDEPRPCQVDNDYWLSLSFWCLGILIFYFPVLTTMIFPT